MMRGLTTAVCVAVATSGIAHAQDAASEKRWRALVREGATQYKLGDFDAAIKSFEEAYRISGSPDILYNLGQAHRQKKSYERAVYFFKTFLREKPNAESRAAIEQLIVELDGLIAAQKTSNDHPPATVSTPPAPQPAAPAPAPVAPAEPTYWYQDPVAWTLAGAGVVAVGVGIGCLIHSGSLSDEAKTTPDEQEAQSKHDSAKTFQIAGGITLGVGVALAAGGIVKMLLHERQPHESPVSVAVSPTGVAVFGRF